MHSHVHDSTQSLKPFCLAFKQKVQYDQMYYLYVIIFNCIRGQTFITSVHNYEANKLYIVARKEKHRPFLDGLKIDVYKATVYMLTIMISWVDNMPVMLLQSTVQSTVNYLSVVNLVKTVC